MTAYPHGFLKLSLEMEINSSKNRRTKTRMIPTPGGKRPATLGSPEFMNNFMNFAPHVRLW